MDKPTATILPFRTAEERERKQMDDRREAALQRILAYAATLKPSKGTTDV